MGAFFKHKEKDSASGDDCVKLCNVHDIIEAERMIELLKENGIAAFSQESGDGVSVYSTAGFGLYGVDVFVEAKNEEQARKLIDAEGILVEHLLLRKIIQNC